MAAQLEDRGILFEMSWVPREQNAEADAITNECIELLNLAKRMAADMSMLPFLILPEMLSKDDFSIPTKKMQTRAPLISTSMG